MNQDNGKAVLRASQELAGPHPSKAFLSGECTFEAPWSHTTAWEAVSHDSFTVLRPRHSEVAARVVQEVGLLLELMADLAPIMVVLQTDASWYLRAGLLLEAVHWAQS